VAQVLSPASDSDTRAALARLCLAGFLAYCSYAICRTPLLPLFARELGADAPMIGFVVAASTLTGIALKLPAGAWSDILGRRPLLLGGALVFAIMPVAYLGVSTLAALVVLRFVHGSATAIFGPVASASLSDIAPAAQRATWLSTYSTVQGAGQAIGPVIAGYLLIAGRFDLAFVGAGIIALAVPLIVAGWVSAPSPGLPRARPQAIVRSIVEIARNRIILVTSGAQAAQFVLNGTLNAFLPLYGRELLGLTLTQVGWLFGLQTLTTLAVRPVMGMLSDRVGRRGMILAGLTVCSGAVAVVPLAATFWFLVAVVVAYAGGVATTTAATSAFITDHAGGRYGTAHGVFGTIYDVGDAFGPIAAGLLVAGVGYARMFQIMAGGALMMVIAFALLSGSSREHVTHDATT
jgi:MFS transporter, DHA1 family, multidrug resistance protein